MLSSNLWLWWRKAQSLVLLKYCVRQGLYKNSLVLFGYLIYLEKKTPNFTVLYEPYFQFEIKAAILKDLNSSKSSLCFIQICPIYLINVLIRCQQDNVWHKLGILQVLIRSVYLWLKHTPCRMSLGLLTWAGSDAIACSFWHRSDGVLYHAFSPAQVSPSKTGESLHKNHWQEMATVIHLPNGVLWGCAIHGPAGLCPVQRFWNV